MDAPSTRPTSETAICGTCGGLAYRRILHGDPLAWLHASTEHADHHVQPIGAPS